MHYVRKVYTILDILAEIGGLYSSISLICLFLVQAFQFRGAYQFVMGDLFTDKDRQPNKRDKSFRRSQSLLMTPEEAHENSVQWSAWRTTKLNLQTFIWPLFRRCCSCAEGDRDERILQKSLCHVFEEVSISRIIKQLRVLNAAVK